MDEEKLERGESIASELFKAIEESQFSIIILSKNYASSTWCLDELAKIMKCREEMGLAILPIFYEVDPTDIRKQTGTFKQAFIDHQEHFKDNIEKVETWRAILREVAGISDWDLHLRNMESPSSSCYQQTSQSLVFSNFSDSTIQPDCICH
ncbi:hypothetical protein ACJW31_12G009700 [Castanea mollissima]